MSSTSRDVARLAGVDRSTVSLVLNDPLTRRVSDGTKERVLAAVRHLGYAPHAAAQQLRARCSRTFLMPFWSFPFGPNFDGVIEGMGLACDRHCLSLLIHGSRDMRGADGARLWASFRPEILLVEAHRLDAEAVAVLRGSGARVVLTIGDSDLEGVHPLVLDLGRPGRLAAAHLVETGATELLAVVPTDPQLALFAEGRTQGFLDACREHGIEPSVLRTAPDGAQIHAWAHSLEPAGAKLGVFAYNDLYALHVIAAARHADVAVPERLAVVGVDDIESGRTSYPPLTTLSFDVVRLGETLVDRAVAVAEGQSVSLDLGSEYRLTVRQST